MRSWLASANAFSAFFALVMAALADFSAVALAAVATSQDFWEASSSASRDAMRALAVAKASAAWQREKESQVENQEKISETGKRHNTVKKAYPGKLEQLLGTRRTQSPKRRTSSSKSIKGKYE
jgi:TRAP-type C4-dicarboxylate transport system substrate-binding protein